MSKTVEFVKLSYVKSPYEHKDAFEFREDRPLKWLQKACFYILKKLKATYISEKVETERHIINGDTFMENLLAQKDNLEYIFGRKPTLLLIGAEDYAKLMSEPIGTNVFGFTSRYMLGRERTLHGLKVYVIPWMKGMIAMPDRLESL